MRKKFVLLLIFLAISFVIASSVFASGHIQRKESILLAKDEVVESDYFAFGERVTLSGTVNGDAYLGGGNIIVDGDVSGDLLAGGGTVNILGKVTGDVRVGGGQVIISGEVNGNVTAAGGSVNISDSAIIDGSLVAGAGSLTVFAPLGRGATIGAGDVILGDTIGGDVTAGVGQLTLTPSAKVEGDLNYWSETDAQIQAGAQISGGTVHNFPPRDDKEQAEKVLGGAAFMFKVVTFLASLLIGILFIKFLPTFTKKTSESIIQKPLYNFGVGVSVIILVPISVLILFVTLIGIPLAIVTVISLLIELYLAKIFVSLALGWKILKSLGQQSNDILALTLGLVIYSILSSIPIIGGIAVILVIITGIGAIVSGKRDFYKQLRAKNLI